MRDRCMMRALSLAAQTCDRSCPIEGGECSRPILSVLIFSCTLPFCLYFAFALIWMPSGIAY